MTDLIRRLRAHVRVSALNLMNEGATWIEEPDALAAEAADEISRLRQALLDVSGKAALGAEAMDNDERGRAVAEGFRVIERFAALAATQSRG